MQTQKDLQFESEVRACLQENLTYVTELQSEMFKEIDSMKRGVRELTWQFAKMEQHNEERQLDSKN